MSLDPILDRQLVQQAQREIVVLKKKHYLVVWVAGSRPNTVYIIHMILPWNSHLIIYDTNIYGKCLVDKGYIIKRPANIYLTSLT